MLKETRKNKNLTQQELADIIKVNRTYISRIENHKINCVSTDLILDLAKALDIDPVKVFLFIISARDASI